MLIEFCKAQRYLRTVQNCAYMAATYSYPGLAAATGTRVDSAAKHTMACKVNSDLLSCWCEEQNDARNHLHRQKMKYCMHKNELALNCGQPLNDISVILSGPARAYPSVTTNLGDMTETSKNILLWLYHTSDTGARFLHNKDQIRDICRKPHSSLVTAIRMGMSYDTQRVHRELKDMPYFMPQGYALGMAFASALSGDTVGTVLVGGMVTVMNGAFEMRAGQMVMWYFDFEDAMFYKSSTEASQQHSYPIGCRTKEKLPLSLAVSNDEINRVKNKTSTGITAQEKSRKEYHDRELGALDAFPLGGQSARKHNIFLPKPYVLDSEGNEHYADKIRVFAKCISGARPFEMVDLMLMTQSL